ncbi:hypothetical protein SKAU_G00029040 [Synaphobranchus kaupii]|uniref:Uncharacterized protein n=1 Tax=Synaphobranchus kaupii TaxID=118154 RepID=A0A9Q1GD88_SYNKA|nr:hypothetical protein SKAU_G00029040 [Synaphobranchus kaupii]
MTSTSVSLVAGRGVASRGSRSAGILTVCLLKGPGLSAADLFVTSHLTAFCHLLSAICVSSREAD